MKIIKINDYEIDIIEENEKYIDIYTFEEICHNDCAYLKHGSWKFIDEGKGWRLSKLCRMDKTTKQTYELTCTPDSNSYNNYLDADIIFINNNIKYHRFININRENFIDYVRQDNITSIEEHIMSEEFYSYMINFETKNKRYYELYFKLLEKSKENPKLRKELAKRKFITPNYKKFVNMNQFQTIKVDLENKKYTLTAIYREYNSEEDELFRSYEEYINDNKTNCEYLPYSTNDLLLSFNEMNKKMQLCGYPDQKVYFYEKTSSGFKKVKKKQIYKIK